MLRGSFSLGSWRFWLIYSVAWLALGVWQGINSIIGFRNAGRAVPDWQPMTWELSSVAVVALLAVAISRFEKRFPLSGPGWPQRIVFHIPAAIVFSLVHTPAMVGLRELVYLARGRHYDFGDWSLGLTYEFQKDVITYALIVGVCATWRIARERRAHELAVIRLERDLGAARLAQLTAQIEPHFIFNTLNAISNRMHEDVDAADTMIAAFADLLRAALTESGDTEVRVVDDAIWLERYFELMRERFRGKLSTHIAVDADVRDARIPRLLLQPLVENAFEHGLADGRGRVDVAVRAHGDRLVCTVEDDGVGIASPIESGVGLANVRSRLELMYPHDHRFAIAPRSGGGTRVEIDLPLRRDG